MRLRMLVEFDYDPETLHDDTPEGSQKFREEVLGDPELIVISNELDGEIGTLRVITIEDD